MTQDVRLPWIPSFHALLFCSITCAVLHAGAGAIAALAWLDIALGAYALILLMFGGALILPLIGIVSGVASLLLAPDRVSVVRAIIAIGANLAIAALLYALGAIYIRE